MNPARALAAEYSAMAMAYARHWSPVIRPMALPLLRELPLRSARTVLDVGTGTGALLPDIRGAAAPDAFIVGLDRAEGMLRVTGRGPSMAVAASDAQDLSVRSAAIDVALLVFVLFHLPDPLRCLHDVRRALRPDGTAGVVTWGTDPGLPGVSLWTETLDEAGAEPDPRDPDVMQQSRMDSTGKLEQLLEEAGFGTVRVWSETMRHQWTVGDLLAAQTACGLPSRRLATLSAAQRARCVSRVRAGLETLTREELVYRPEVVFAVARPRTATA